MRPVRFANQPAAAGSYTLGTDQIPVKTLISTKAVREDRAAADVPRAHANAPPRDNGETGIHARRGPSGGQDAWDSLLTWLRSAVPEITDSEHVHAALKAQVVAPRRPIERRIAAHHGDTCGHAVQGFHLGALLEVWEATPDEGKSRDFMLQEYLRLYCPEIKGMDTFRLVKALKTTLAR